MRSVATAENGTRNTAFFHAACTAFGSGYDDGSLAELTQAARAAGLPDAEITKALQSARTTVELGRKAH